MPTAFDISYAALWILVILQSVILLGLVRMVSQLQQSGATSNSTATSGEEAPQFSAVDLSGKTINNADFAGRLTALLFVSSRCPSCMTTLAELNALAYKSMGNMIVICRTGREDAEMLAETYKLNVPVIADEDDRISQLFGITSVPTAVLINARNRIQSVGYPLREELEQAFEVEKPPEVAVQGAS